MRSYITAFTLWALSASANSALLSPDPSQVCDYLSSFGLATRGWKNQYDKEFGCSSPYKEIGAGAPLANNIAYYVEGGRTTANRAKLVMNINNKGSAESAHRELLKVAENLSPKVTGVGLPKEIAAAITNGTNASRTAGPSTIEVIRINWPTGKGYEVKVFFE